MTLNAFPDLRGFTLWSNSLTEKEDGDNTVKWLMCEHTPLKLSIKQCVRSVQRPTLI